MSDKRSYKRLQYEDRKRIEDMCQKEVSVEEMASELGVHRATIYNELLRGGVTKSNRDRKIYNADVAQRSL